MFENTIGQKPRKSSPSVLVPYRNRSGVIDLVGREPLMFAKVENGVTKSSKIFPGKTGKTQFWPEIFHFFEQGCLLFARVDISVTEFPTEQTKKKKRNFGSEIFFFKSGCASLEFFNFLAAKKLTFWGGGV